MSDPIAVIHTVHIELVVWQGNVGVHFSRYYGPGHYRKLAHRDDDDQPPHNRVHAGESWTPTITFPKQEAGVYLIDLADWEDNPSVKLTVTIDDVVWFLGVGAQNKIDDWPIKEFYYARKTDDREVAFDIPDYFV